MKLKATNQKGSPIIPNGIFYKVRTIPIVDIEIEINDPVEILKLKAQGYVEEESS
tara:strand:- start:310 stop:474 length:165 start_codon:yes stop_codon:yes gene_type:complete